MTTIPVCWEDMIARFILGYVNRCGFHIVEFYNKFHPDPNDPEGEHMDLDNQFPDGMFKFEKIMNGGRK